MHDGGASSNGRVWFITGASSGLGAILAKAALVRGDRVVATARRLGSLDDLASKGATIMAMDVAKPEQIAAALEATKQKFGRLDVLVNSAGYARIGAVEESADADTRAQFDVNVFGLMNVIRAALPLLRANGGRIVNFSSLAGFTGMAGAANYCASKFAVEGLSEALAAELAPLGVKVLLVAPGAFKTGFNSNLQLSPAMSEYEATVGQLRQWLAASALEAGADPAPTAAAILCALDAENPPFRLLLGADALEGARAKLDALRREFDAWEDVTLFKRA